MSDELFNELVESVKEAGGYLRGEQTPERVHDMGKQEPRQSREQLGLTEDEFDAA